MLHALIDNDANVAMPFVPTYGERECAEGTATALPAGSADVDALLGVTGTSSSSETASALRSPNWHV